MNFQKGRRRGNSLTDFWHVLIPKEVGLDNFQNFMNFPNNRLGSFPKEYRLLVWKSSLSCFFFHGYIDINLVQNIHCIRWNCYKLCVVGCWHCLRFDIEYSWVFLHYKHKEWCSGYLFSSNFTFQQNQFLFGKPFNDGFKIRGNRWPYFQ